MTMRIHQLQHLLVVGILVGVASVAHAQDSTPAKKPGGLNKVAHDVSRASKTAGRQIKAGVKDVASDAHATLTKAGNDTKAEAKRVTGYTTPAPSPDHKPGGLN